MELNPNHPVTRMTHDQWHKVVGILMMKFAVTDIEITVDDIVALGDNEKAVMADCRNGKFIIRLRSYKEAQEIARMEGGLPQ